MLVEATNKYEELNLRDKELNRIPKTGEKFEVTEERFEVLSKNNKYNAAFVKRVEEIEIAKKEIKVETAVKKTKKKIKQYDI